MLSDCRNLNRLTGNRGLVHSAHWLASSLKLVARCPVSGCWPSCFVVDVDTVCLFKARLDKFWMHQDVLYDFTADLTGIGEQISMRIKLIVVLDIQK